MALFAYNLTTSPLTLAAGNRILPASLTLGQKGPPVNVTSELYGLTFGQYQALAAQQAADAFALSWTDGAEYEMDTGGVGPDITVEAGGGGGAVAAPSGWLNTHLARAQAALSIGDTQDVGSDYYENKSDSMFPSTATTMGSGVQVLNELGRPIAITTADNSDDLKASTKVPQEIAFYTAVSRKIYVAARVRAWYHLDTIPSDWWVMLGFSDAEDNDSLNWSGHANFGVGLLGSNHAEGGIDTGFVAMAIDDDDQRIIDLGVPTESAAPLRFHDLEIWFDGTDWYGRGDGGTAVKAESSGPYPNVDMYFGLWMYSKAAANRQFDVMRTVVVWDDTQSTAE